MENKRPISDGTFKITGNWQLQSEKLKIKYPKLTDADLKYETGKETALLTRLEIKLNKKRDEVIGILNKSMTESPS